MTTITSDPGGLQCPDISDSDIFEAMKEIPGYLDITPSDLKDIYRHAFRHALERLNRPVTATQVMTRPVHHVSVDTPIEEVAELMAERRVSGVPVLDKAGRVAGIVSEKDFLSRMGPPGRVHVMGIVAACLGGRKCLATPIRGRLASEIMTSPAITVREEASTLEIMEIFNTRNINRVPVLDSAGKLSGIVSRGDLLRARPARRE
jgi:CBS-domain-containing membrane protein